MVDNGLKTKECLRQFCPSGFTFIEMVMVIVLMGILLGIGIPMYQAQIVASKEQVLAHNLATIRERLDQYKADKNRYPQNLQELTESGYLRQLPQDPMTGAHEWDEVYEEFDPDEPDAKQGVYDIKSRSTDTSTDGRPYNEW